jgi:hypothetical protein
MYAWKHDLTADRGKILNETIKIEFEIRHVFRHLPVSASRSHPSLKRRGNFLWDAYC